MHPTAILCPTRLGLLPALCTALLAGASALSAQTTWVVDANNGPGTQFTDVPPAVAAAAVGDTVRVRAGTYSATTIGKGLRLLGEGTVTLTALTVTSLPAADELAIEGVDVATTLSLSDNDGRIHLDAVTGPRLPLFGISIARCRLVTVEGGAFLQPSVSDSRLVAVSTRFTAVAATAAQPALTLRDSDVVLVDGQAQGASGSCSFGRIDPGQAIVQSGGTLTLSGDRSSITAGAHGASCTTRPPTPGILSNGGMLIVDPGVVVTGSNGPAISGSSTLVSQSVPALTATAAPPGGQLATDLYAPSGQIAFVLVSIATAPQPTPFGEIWIHLPTHVLLQTGPIGGSQHLTNALPLSPAFPAGLALTLQAGLLDGAQLRLSTPVIVVLD